MTHLYIPPPETIPAISVTNSDGRCILKLNRDGTIESDMNEMDETVRIFLQVLREQWIKVAPAADAAALATQIRGVLDLWRGGHTTYEMQEMTAAIERVLDETN